MFTLSDLPLPIRHTFNKKFTPLYIEYVGKSSNPWDSNPKVSKLQAVFNAVYPEVEIEVVEGEAIWWMVLSFLYCIVVVDLLFTDVLQALYSGILQLPRLLVKLSMLHSQK
jgi:hypothetical protein